MNRIASAPSRRGRFLLLALCLFLLTVTAHSFRLSREIFRLDPATVSRQAEDYSLALRGDDVLRQSFRLSRTASRLGIHITPCPEGETGRLTLRLLDGDAVLASESWADGDLARTADLMVRRELSPGEYSFELAAQELSAPVQLLSRPVGEASPTLNGAPALRAAAFTGEYRDRWAPVPLLPVLGAAALLLWFFLSGQRTCFRVGAFAAAVTAAALGVSRLAGVRELWLYLAAAAGIWLAGPALLARRALGETLRSLAGALRERGYVLFALAAGALIGAAAEALVSSRMGQPFLWGRGTAFMVPGFLAALFLVRGKRLLQSPEKSFAAVGLALSLYLALLLPPVTGISWDDQIHYDRTVALSQGVWTLTSDAERGLADIDYAATFSQTGEKDLRTRIAADHRNDGGQRVFSRRNLGPDRIGYLPQAVGLWLGQILELPCPGTFLLGRACGAVFYILLFCLCIRILPGGKLVLLALGLLPTGLFLTASYSYDVWVTGFLALGFALFFSQLETPGEPLSRRSAALMLGCIVLGCLPKGIYGLSMLLFLLMPRDKFPDRRSCRRFRIWILALTAALLVYSAVPQILDVLRNQGGGDHRGGEGISTLGQAKYVLAHPLEYAGVLLRFLGGYLSPKNAFEYTSSMAYLGRCATSVWLMLPMLAAGLLDREEESFALDRRPGLRLAGLGILLLQTAAVATVFYLVFTPVGSAFLAGCQYRYLLPLLFPAVMLGLHSGRAPRLPVPVKTAAVTLISAALSCLVIWELAASRFVP